MPRPATPAQQSIHSVWWMVGIVLGVAAQLQQAALWQAMAYGAMLAAVLAGAALLCRWPHWRMRWLAGILGVALGAGTAGLRAVHMHHQALPMHWQGKDLRVTGVIAEMPQPSERGVRLQLEVTHAQLVAAPEQVRTQPLRLALTWYGALPPQGLKAGQRWRWTVRVKAPHGSRNPHSMDWELWMWGQGIHATGYVRQGLQDAAPQWLGQTWQAPVAQLRGKVLERMNVPEGASPALAQAYGVVQALVTGAQSRIEPMHWQLFRDTGVAHLVSISGLHITMFAWLATAVLNMLWRRSVRLCVWLPAPIAAAWAGLALATAYAVFSGWGVPAQRTIGMLGIVVWLQSLGCRWPWPCVWLCALVAVVLWAPWSLLQAGFWLSFVAVGVLLAAQHRTPGHKAQSPRWWCAAQQLLREQAAIGLALAPLTLLLFGQISLVGLVANLWAIPWVTLVVTPLAMLGMLLPLCWWLSAQCVDAMVVALQWMAAWPWSVLHFAQPPWWAAAAGVLGCMWMAMPWPWRWRCWGLPCALPMLVWQPPTPAHGQFEVLALDVGQGSAVLVRTQQHSLLFDTGPQWSDQANAGERVVVPVLRALGVRLNQVVVSHADNDHAGGAQAVQQAYPNAQWLGHGGVPCHAGQQWHWDGVHFQVLHPPVPQPVDGRSSNAQSCVLRVVASTGIAALLTGDIGLQQERALLQAGQPLRAAWVLAPHHGSRTSSSAAWLAAVQPQVAVAQAGYLNRFGHPHPVVVARYRAQGVQWADTARCGAAWWHTAVPNVLRCERALHRRYWHTGAPDSSPGP